MLTDLVLILVVLGYTILAGAALYGAGAAVGRFLRRRLALVVEDPTADDDTTPIFVGDFGQLAPLPEALYETWQPARPGDTPGALVPGEADTVVEPACCGMHNSVDCNESPWGAQYCCPDCPTGPFDAPTEPMPAEAPIAVDPPVVRPYAMGGWVEVGNSRVHRACSDARRDRREPCEHCGPLLGRVTVL